MKLQNLEETAHKLLELEHITILTHRRPDGDALGSAGALCAGLRALGKQAWVLENPQATPRYAAYVADMTTVEPVGMVISVDIAARAQLPVNYDGEVVLSIDHHEIRELWAWDTYAEPESAACGEIIYLLLKQMGVELTKDMANALYVAISTDTGCFRYSNTTPRTLRIAAELLELGADHADLNHEIFEVKSRARMALENHLAGNMRSFCGGRISFCFLSWEDQQRMQVTEDDADSIAPFTRNIEGVEVGGILRSLPDGKCKVSLRSDPKLWDCSAICAMLGGGGHKAASGATVATDFEGLLKALLDAISKVGNLEIAEDQ